MPRRREPTGRQRACSRAHTRTQRWKGGARSRPIHGTRQHACSGMQLQHQSQLSTTACTACTACTAFRIRQRARTRASAPNSIRCSGNRGMGARGTVQSTRTHVWSPFGRDKLQSLFNERNSCSKFVPCQIVSVGRGGGSPPLHRRAAHARTRVSGARPPHPGTS